MTLPTGTISMNQVAAELGISQSGLSLNHGWVRALANKASGTISMSDLQGQSANFNGNLTTVLEGTAPGTLNVHPNCSFMRGTLVTFGQNRSGGSTLVFDSNSVPPVYVGNIRVTNNNLGITAIFTKQFPNAWSSSTDGLVGNQGDTYNYSIYPST